MFTNIDQVRRECVRIGSLLDRGDTVARDAISAIQIEADKGDAAAKVEPLGKALEALLATLVETTHKGQVVALASKGA